MKQRPSKVFLACGRPKCRNLREHPMEAEDEKSIIPRSVLSQSTTAPRTVSVRWIEAAKFSIAGKAKAVGLAGGRSVRHRADAALRSRSWNGMGMGLRKESECGGSVSGRSDQNCHLAFGDASLSESIARVLALGASESLTG